MSLLVRPRAEAPGRILGRGANPGRSGHFKVFKAGKQTDVKINSGSFCGT